MNQILAMALASLVIAFACFGAWFLTRSAGPGEDAGSAKAEAVDVLPRIPLDLSQPSEIAREHPDRRAIEPSISPIDSSSDTPDGT